ncbi:MAG: ATP-binding cassette domain-containing protein, partial [Planctomycetota bacterium]|nr:ATP-binding cassette domain-containing protein [Planctomycetota bacterium]
LTSSSLPDAVSFMPQSPVLLDATILDNILFGRSGNRDVPAALEAEELDLVERIGLGRVCRLKAIDMTPPTGEGLSALDGGVAGLRRRARQWLKDRCQADVLPFESGYSDRRHWILECLLGGRCDRTATIGLLQEHEGRRISSLVPPELAARIARAGQTFLRQSGQLLGIANYHVYAQLAPCPVSEPLWKLLSANAHLCGWQALTPRETATLCIIGLTCCPNDLAGDERADDWRLPEARHAGEQDVRRLREALASVCVPFELDKVHPHLTWRENLLFGVLDARNARTRQAVDNGLLEFIEQDSLREPMTQAGLQSEVGRSGRNLSGGQGQLVALCRAILRRTAVLVLDEPTASLDPASRTRVAEFLRQYVGPRIVISVSHDPEFVRRADEVKVMDGGRLVASGTFDQLKEGSDVFRRILGQT